MKTIKQLYRFPTLSLRTELINEYMKAKPAELQFPVVDKSCLVGVEVEVENLEHYPIFSVLWDVTDDGSLRNHGREYISWPMRGDQIEYALRHLFSVLNKEYKPQFTPRCSVHVHMNARTMTTEHVRSLVMLYLIFERAFFKFVGANREKNIHCVPLYESNITWLFDRIAEGRESPSRWMKYTALNLCPLSQKGTIEFRHMHGTDNVEKLMIWINLLLKLKLYAYRHSREFIVHEIYALNSASSYRRFAHDVFGEYASYVFPDQHLRDAAKFMEAGSTEVKGYLDANLLLKELHELPITHPKVVPLSQTSNKKQRVFVEAVTTLLGTHQFDNEAFNGLAQVVPQQPSL